MAPKQPTPEIPRHIPWGYGKNRVAAMPVDPERLYAYWEVTDAALEAARSEFGPQGCEAFLALRVHDVTGRIFDGSNSHSWIDVPVSRTDRQWFMDVNRPSSAVVVEIGLCGPEGRFLPLARSHSVEFPRRDPVAAGEPRWGVVRESPSPPEGAEGRPFHLESVPAGAPGDSSPSGSSAPAPERAGRDARSRPLPSAGTGSEGRLGGESSPGGPGGSEVRLRRRTDPNPES